MTVATPDYDNMRVQYFDGTDWQDFGPVHALDISTRNRRFAGAMPVTAQRWRIVSQVKDNQGGAIAVGGLSVQQSSGALSRGRHVPFAFNSTQFYSIWLSHGNARVFYQGFMLADIAIPHSADDLLEVTYAQALDTLILYHKDHSPWRIQRQGAHDAWDSRAVVYENQPIFDYDGTSAGGIDHVQQVRFKGYENGDSFTLTLAGETTTTLTYSLGNLAAVVRNGLGGLKNVDLDGLSVGSSSSSATTDDVTTVTAIVTVTFRGENGSQEWPEMFGSTIDSDEGGVVASTFTRGRAGGENIMSDARGWPRAGAFNLQRQWLGGFRSRPSTLGASVLGDYFNLNIDLDTDDVGIDVTLDGADVVEIRHIIPGRHLVLFTASAEYFVPNGALTRDTIQVQQTSAVGVRVGIRPIVVDGPVIFIERRSGAMRAFVFSEGEQSYVPEVISMHASHLLTDPVDMSRRIARNAKEADLFIIPNFEGFAAALTLLRSHDIVAFTRFTTQGQIMAVGVENNVSVELMVERGGRRFLEYMSDSAYLDNSLIFTADDQAVFDVPHLTGDVIVMRDGRFWASATVEAGRVTVSDAVTGQIEIGYEYEVGFETLPVRRLSESGGFSKNRIRIVRADLNVEQCTAFELSVNGGRFYKYAPAAKGLVLGEARRIYESEQIKTKGFPGSSYRPSLTFRQAVPGPFHLRSLDMETSE